jgi:hypothetical protein
MLNGLLFRNLGNHIMPTQFISCRNMCLSHATFHKVLFYFFFERSREKVERSRTAELFGPGHFVGLGLGLGLKKS